MVSPIVILPRHDTAHGALILVELTERELAAAHDALPTAEQAHCERLSAVRRREWIGGRTALHLALADFARPIGVDDRGAPQLPDGWVGSVSHKGALAGALLAAAGSGWIGLDIERAVAPRIDIAPRILSERELAEVPDRGSAVTLRFALKEAIYKAIDPVMRRYVGFREVELEVGPDGDCRVMSHLPLAIEASWLRLDGHWIATARARRRPL